MMDAKEVTVLLVEDDDGDAKMVRRAFSKAHIANPLVRSIDGVQALELLRGENGQKAIRRPYILLVDVNMPRMDGLTLVKELRADRGLKSTIVFMLTTSRHDEDRYRAYDLNVAGYIVKQNAGQDFVDLVNLIGGYSRIVELP